MSVCPDKSNFLLFAVPENSHFWLCQAAFSLLVFFVVSRFTRNGRVQKYVPPS
jgi:hypothetical protein